MTELEPLQDTASNLLTHSEAARRRFLQGSAMLTGVAAIAAAPEASAAAGTGTAEDHFAIERLIYQYAIAVDYLDAAAFNGCFVPGGALIGDQGELFKGEGFKGDLGADVMKVHREGAECTMHRVLNHVHTVRGQSATGLTYGIATWVVKDEAGKRTQLDLYMRYTDELVKRNALWLFQKRYLEVLFTTEGPVKSFHAKARSGNVPPL